MARLNACGVEADALPRRGLTLRVQADAVPTAGRSARRAERQPLRCACAGPNPVARGSLSLRQNSSARAPRGYRAASDITRCWPQASCLSQARCAASMPRKTPRPSNPRFVNGRQHVLVLHLRAAPAAQCLAPCTRCARLRAIHGLLCTALRRWLHACARAPARRRPPELAHGLDASMRFLSSPSMARRLRGVLRGCARVVRRGFGSSLAAR